jgi:hypothetical protein
MSSTGNRDARPFSSSFNLAFGPWRVLLLGRGNEITRIRDFVRQCPALSSNSDCGSSAC